MRLLHSVASMALVLALGCGRPPQVAHPRIPDRGAPESERRRVYEENALHVESQLARTQWRRTDGKLHSWAELEDVAQQYPETRELRTQAGLRDGVFECLAGAGLVVLAGTGIHQFAANDEQDFSNGVATGLYIAGASALGLALLLKLLVPDPKSRFADTYNSGLREQLGLPSDQR